MFTSPTILLSLLHKVDNLIDTYFLIHPFDTWPQILDNGQVDAAVSYHALPVTSCLEFAEDSMADSN